jgi:hypothetical protein
MQTQVDETKVEQRRRTSDESPYTFDDLQRKDSRALAEIYSSGRVTDVSALSGYPQGRMLAVRGLDRAPVMQWVNTLATTAFFPWEGKSFKGSANAGTGINRVHLFGRHQLFPFLTAVGPSALDGMPAIILNYDLRENPRLIRRIHDEVREVSPGVYLGPAMWKTAGGKAHLLWFALDTNRQCDPIEAGLR